jgi:hypothetical protein
LTKGEKYERDDYDTQEKKVQPYTPVCTQAELKKMLEPNHRSTKFSHVEGRIDNWIDKQKYDYEKAKIREANDTKKKNRPISTYTGFDADQQSKEFRLKTDLKV